MFKVILAHTTEEIFEVEKLFHDYTEWCKENFVRTGLLNENSPELKSFNKEVLPGEYQPPNGFLALAYFNDKPAGCMFLHKLHDTTCELKRFYIRPEARGEGLSIAMLNWFCSKAKELGYTRLRISSHSFMSKAIQIYHQYGFYKIPNYVKDPLQSGNVQMELNLTIFKVPPIKRSIKNSEHYKWGNNCDGWHLHQSDSLHFIREQMPSGASENLHYHEQAQQIFYLLSGIAEFEIDGMHYTLASNESISVNSKSLHRIYNSGKEEVNFLLISQPKAHGDRIDILDYSLEFKESIKTLNVEWLEKYFHVEPNDVVQLSNPQIEILDKGGLIYFAKRNNKIVGTVSLLKVTDEVYELGKMAVTENEQGHYIGNALIEHCFNVANQKKIKKLVLYSNTSLKPAIHLYKKYGFVETELENGHYERANIKMEKIFAY